MASKNVSALLNRRMSRRQFGVAGAMTLGAVVVAALGGGAARGTATASSKTPEYAPRHVSAVPSSDPRSNGTNPGCRCPLCTSQAETAGQRMA